MLLWRRLGGDQVCSDIQSTIYSRVVVWRVRRAFQAVDTQWPMRDRERLEWCAEREAGRRGERRACLVNKLNKYSSGVWGGGLTFW